MLQECGFPKEEATEQFRVISLLCVECKIFKTKVLTQRPPALHWHLNAEEWGPKCTLLNTRQWLASRFWDLILDYYNNFHLRITIGLITSEWQCLEKGGITGCTTFVTVFALHMDILVKAAEVPCPR